MHSILLFEEDKAKIPSLVFLLKLADISCTVAKTVEEFLNWLQVEKFLGPRFDLVLLTSLQGSGMDNMMLTELCEFNTAPVVCVMQPDVSPAIFLIHPVATCSPDSLLDCVKEQIRVSKTELPLDVSQ